MIGIRCPVPGTYLVRDDSGALPVGQTESSFSVVVHHYRFGWVCEQCGFRAGSTLQDCKHVRAAQRAAR